MYCKTQSNPATTVTLELDGLRPDTTIRLNGTTCSNGVTVAPDNSDPPYDGDHQLVGHVSQLLGDYVYIEQWEYVCPDLAPLRPKYNVLIVSPLPELKTRLETASTFSVPDQLRRTYPPRRSSWTILTRR